MVALVSAILPSYMVAKWAFNRIMANMFFLLINKSFLVLLVILVVTTRYGLLSFYLYVQVVKCFLHIRVQLHVLISPIKFVIPNCADHLMNHHHCQHLVAKKSELLPLLVSQMQLQ